ncbi:MAG: hypothetical protein JWO77_187, partial [Ilumatobacteraceae bacterium]|nr:hypothetical protein [Ilumatobacteraceae bacterium]
DLLASQRMEADFLIASRIPPP